MDMVQIERDWGKTKDGPPIITDSPEMKSRYLISLLPIENPIYKKGQGIWNGKRVMVGPGHPVAPLQIEAHHEFVTVAAIYVDAIRREGGASMPDYEVMSDEEADQYEMFCFGRILGPRGQQAQEA